jgi:hypothetical protein
MHDTNTNRMIIVLFNYYPLNQNTTRNTTITQNKRGLYKTCVYLVLNKEKEKERMSTTAMSCI